MVFNYKGVAVHYTIEGSGKTVILLHGFLENLSMWDEIKQMLLKSHRVVCVDLLGHGKTPCLGYVHTMEEMAQVVEEILSSHRIRKSIFIGHSMGGYVALAFADKNPDKTKGICLLNSAARNDSKVRLEGRETAIRVAKKQYEGVIKISIRNLFRYGDDDRFRPIVKKLIQEALEMPRQGFFAAQEGMKRRPNREHVLKNASFSKLMITGKHDDILCLEEQEEESQRTQTPLVVLSEGHMSHLENTTEVIDILSKFVRNI